MFEKQWKLEIVDKRENYKKEKYEEKLYQRNQAKKERGLSKFSE